MARVTVRPVGHEDRLSIVEHLDELRSRLIVCIVAFVAVFAVCAWQDDKILQIVNRPLESTTQRTTSGGRISETAKAQTTLRRALEAQTSAFEALARDGNLSAAEQTSIGRAIARTQQAILALPKTVPKRLPVTLGVSEPFTSTLTVAAWAALLVTLPLILFQLYGFLLPAFTPREKEIALPILLSVPFLFIAGVVFGYFVVMPAAIGFLQNFNADSFDILIQAKDYYRFMVMSLISIGALFEIPVVILGITRLGIVSVDQIRRSRRYAIVVIAVVAMLLPGTDPVTMLLSMLPLLVLFEASILMAAFLDRRSARAADPEGGLIPADPYLED